GITLAKLAADTGLQVREIERDGARLDPGAAIIAAGDVLTLEGAAQAFAASANLFRSTDLADAEVDRAVPPRRNTDTESIVTFTPHPEGPCDHLASIRPVHPSAPGCEECLRIGDEWVHLRICLTCGHVGCCDSSKNKHAAQHFHATTHPIMRSH